MSVGRLALATWLSFGLVVLLLLAEGDPVVNGLASIGIVLCVISLTSHPYASLRRDPFHPAVSYKGIMLLSYFWGLSRLSTDTTFSRETLVSVGLLGLAFLVMVDILLMALPGKKAVTIPDDDGESPVPVAAVRILFLTYAAGWLWRLYAMRQGLLYGTLLATQLEVTATTNLFGALNNLAFLGFLGLSVFSRRSSTLWFALLEMVWAASTGSKAAVLYVFVPLLLVWYQKGRMRLNAKWVMALGVLAGAFILSFAFVQQYRAASQATIYRSGYAGFSPLSAGSAITLSLSNVGEITEALLDRANLAKNIALLLEADRDHSIPSWRGSSFLPVFTWFVPRALWPDKPTVSVGEWYGRVILGWNYDSRSEGAITLWGDAYMNFGWIGALLIPAAWTVLLSRGYELLVRRVWGLFFMSAVYMRILIGIEQNLAAPLVAMQQTAMLIGGFWLVIRLMTVSSRRISSEVNLSGQPSSHSL